MGDGQPGSQGGFLADFGFLGDQIGSTSGLVAAVSFHHERQDGRLCVGGESRRVPGRRTGAKTDTRTSDGRQDRRLGVGRVSRSIPWASDGSQDRFNRGGRASGRWTGVMTGAWTSNVRQDGRAGRKRPSRRHNQNQKGEGSEGAFA
jgi:hypothetical protein